MEKKFKKPTWEKATLDAIFNVATLIGRKDYLKGDEVVDIITDAIDKLAIYDTEEERDDLFDDINQEIIPYINYIVLESGESFYISPTTAAIKKFLKDIEISDTDNCWNFVVRAEKAETYFSLAFFWLEFCQKGGEE